MSVKSTADQHRVDAIMQLENSGNFHKSTLARSKQIDETCNRIVADHGVLTVTNIVEVCNRLFPNSRIGESTIRNKTSSATLYKGVIDAWKVCQFAKSRLRVTETLPASTPDIADSAIGAIQPESARLSVLLLRTAYRNALSQLHALQGFTSDRLIRLEGGTSTAPASADNKKKNLSEVISKHEIRCLRALLDDTELLLRGLEWGADGQLSAMYAGASSGPGIKIALSKLLDFAEGLD
jgi:hypothetical protein